MRGILEPEHLLLILVTLLVMFGGRKIPELAGGIGKGVREFKKGLHDPGTQEPITFPGEQAATTSTIVAPPPAPAAPAREGPKRLLG